jgi:hypothetical protein
MKYWYYMKDSQRNGPVGENELVKLLVSGVIDSSSMVWNKDIKDWTSACDVDALIPSDFRPPPPPVMPPPLVDKATGESDDDSAGSMPATHSPYVGLGGWLVLPAVGIIIAPFIMLFTKLLPEIKLLRGGVWELLAIPGSDSYIPWWGPLFAAEMTINLGITVAWIFIAFLFFSKKKCFPMWYIGTMTFTLGFMVIDAIASKLAFPDLAAFDQNTVTVIAQQLVATLIWGRYMWVSRRVKATFVNQLRPSIIPCVRTADSSVVGQITTNVLTTPEEEEFYKQAANEYDSDTTPLSRGLMAKAHVLSTGDERVARSHYIALRVAQLTAENRNKLFNQRIMQIKKKASKIMACAALGFFPGIYLVTWLAWDKIPRFNSWGWISETNIVYLYIMGPIPVAIICWVIASKLDPETTK